MELIRKRFAELTADELYEILRLRAAVFVVEQSCAYQDIDGRDRGALHIWLRDADGIQAYLRVMNSDDTHPCPTIGRVIAVKRRCGLGTRIVHEGIAAARECFGAERIYLEAQVYAKELYEKCGFTQVTEPFDEDGIPHIGMELIITD